MGHPAHFHLFKNTIAALQARGHLVQVLIKKKDILEDLLRSAGLEHININPEGRGDSKLAIILGLLKREWEFYKVIRKFKPDIMAGTSAEIAHLGFLLGIPSLVFNEDDASVVPYFAKVAYPFAKHVVAPDCTDVGKWNSKKIGYPGYHELAYLHPNNFIPNPLHAQPYKDRGRYFVLRFAKLTAHHDEGRTGISNSIASRLIEILKPYGEILITSEREINSELEPYRVAIDPLHIHSLLYYADLYIGDSQTMAAEAAVLGTPSIRFNDFAGEITYLEELEHLFGLTTGIPTKDVERLFEITGKYAKDVTLKQQFEVKRSKMLESRIDCAGFFTKLISDFPC